MELWRRTRRPAAAVHAMLDGRHGRDRDPGEQGRLEKRLERLRWRQHNSRDDPSSFDVLQSHKVEKRIGAEKENFRNADNREVIIACDAASQAFALPCSGLHGKKKSAMTSYDGNLKRSVRGGKSPRRVAFATVGRACP